MTSLQWAYNRADSVIESCVRCGSLLLLCARLHLHRLPSSLLSMAFPNSATLPLVPIWLWCPCCCLPHWVPFPCRLIKLPQTLPINNQSFVKSPLLYPVSTEILEFLSHGSELTSVSWLLIHHDLISVPSKALPLRMPHFGPSIANNLSWPDLIVSFVFFFSGCYLLALE